MKLVKFELALCPRNANGEKVGEAQLLYRGNNPAAVEAVFLRNASKKEKKVDLFEAHQRSEGY